MYTTRFQTLLVLALCVFGIWAAHTGPTREPNEQEGVFFTYNGHSHSLIIKVRNGHDVKCYVIALTDSEKMEVHQDAGLRTIELKYLAMLSAATPTTVDTLTTFDKHTCGHVPHNGTIEYFNM